MATSIPESSSRTGSLYKQGQSLLAAESTVASSQHSEHHCTEQQQPASPVQLRWGLCGCLGRSQSVAPVCTDRLKSQMSLDGSILHFNWAQRKEAKSCMNTLVLALEDDPVNAYFSGQKRKHFVKEEVKGYLKALPGATNFIATPDSQAVALWQLLPQETPANELLAGWTRILRVPVHLWGSLFKLELHYEHAHEEIASGCGSYYYLSFIGTHPSARGKGYGSLLLKHITDRADAEQRWCLLEATSERSQALYARHGFETYEVYTVNKSCPPVFFMKRQPQQPKEQQQVARPAQEAAAVATAASAGETGGKLVAAVEVKELSGGKVGPEVTAVEGLVKIAAVHDVAALSNQDQPQHQQQQEEPGVTTGLVTGTQEGRSLYQTADAGVLISGASIISGSSDSSSSSERLVGLVEQEQMGLKSNAAAAVA